MHNIAGAVVGAVCASAGVLKKDGCASGAPTCCDVLRMRLVVLDGGDVVVGACEDGGVGDGVGDGHDADDKDACAGDTGGANVAAQETSNGTTTPPLHQPSSTAQRTPSSAIRDIERNAYENHLEQQPHSERLPSSCTPASTESRVNAGRMAADPAHGEDSSSAYDAESAHAYLTHQCTQGEHAHVCYGAEKEDTFQDVHSEHCCFVHDPERACGWSRSPPADDVGAWCLHIWYRGEQPPRHLHDNAVGWDDDASKVVIRNAAPVSRLSVRRSTRKFAPSPPDSSLTDAVAIVVKLFSDQHLVDPPLPTPYPSLPTGFSWAPGAEEALRLVGTRARHHDVWEWMSAWVHHYVTAGHRASVVDAIAHHAKKGVG